MDEGPDRINELFFALVAAAALSRLISYSINNDFPSILPDWAYPIGVLSELGLILLSVFFLAGIWKKTSHLMTENISGMTYTILAAAIPGGIRVLYKYVLEALKAGTFFPDKGTTAGIFTFVYSTTLYLVYKYRKT